MLRKFLDIIINILWILSCRKEYRRFEKALKKGVSQTQKDVLLSILNKNKDTEFGKKYKFANIKNIGQFQDKVPLSDIEDYSAYINDIARNGKNNVLTNQKVLIFELSSGSASASKLIPYTKGLKKDFHKGLLPWLYDLYINRPKIWRGKSYWSLSPIVNEGKYTKAGIRIGFEKDSEYFGFFRKFLFEMLLATPSELRFVKDADLSRYISLLFLLKEKNLSFISIWNPAFLKLLINSLEDNWERLINDLRKGLITTTINIEPDLKSLLEKKLGRNKKRAVELDKIYKEYKNNISGTEIPKYSLYELIWKNLTLISCWTDSHSALFKEDIIKYFPNVEIQGKGLLSTEGIISFPFANLKTPITAIRSHFMEFKSIETNEIKTISELELNKEYSVIITTNGGLYRYKLADIISVKGFYKDCPLISFMGKEQKISDYFGEKLNEYHISKILKQLFAYYEINPVFYMMAPERDSNENYYYVLFIELDYDYISDNKQKLHHLITELERKLERNFHYEYCIKLKQLQPVKLFIIHSKGNEKYINRCKDLGQKIGDIKAAVLHTKTGWDKVFDGSYLS
ncbi:MAG: GH3 auxin-responsive promoter family protein [Spirochaetota bacterium]